MLSHGSIWDVPEPGSVKINVHVVVAGNPLENDYRVGAGAIIRGPAGERLWTASGTLSDLSEEQAVVTAIHAACEFAISKDWDATYVETVSPRVFDIISLPDLIPLNDDLLPVYRNLYTLFVNNFKVGLTKRRIACIPQFKNGTAEYLANFGLANMTEFGMVEHAVGNLDYHLARDMGRTLIPPYIAVNQILGDGEVVDGPPPPKKRKLLPPSPLAADKGKSKVLSSYSFNDNGILNSQAMQLLDGGKLSCFSSELAKKEVNMEAVVGKGIHAKDVLHHALNGSMESIIPKLFVPRTSSKLEDIKGFMTVE